MGHCCLAFVSYFGTSPAREPSVGGAAGALGATGAAGCGICAGSDSGVAGGFAMTPCLPDVLEER